MNARPRRVLVLVATLVTALIATAAPSPAQDEPAGPRRLPAPQPGAKRATAERDPGTVLVRFKPGTKRADRDRILGSHGARRVADAGATGYEVADLPSGTTPDDAVKALEAESAVVDAEPNFLRRAHARPNDPALRVGDQDYLKRVRLLASWNLTKGSTSKKIAILDTGVAVAHEDLAARIKPGYNAFTNGSGVADGNGHGTMLAGIAAAVTNNGKGIAGAAYNAGIMPVKVLDSDGIGTDADIAEGITWAADHGATVINMSFGGPAPSQVLAEAIWYAHSRGIVLVSSAGNHGAEEVSYPAAYGPVIAVSSTDNDSVFAFFSNYGWWVDVAAPGVGIVGPLPGNEYAIGDGTSFSAALVSGIAFLVKVRFPNLSPAQVQQRIRTTSRDYGPRGIDRFYGAGRVDAYAALGMAPLSPGALPPWDGLEPNGAADRAVALASSANGTISPEGDEDWYALDVPEQGSVTFTVTPPDVLPSGPRTTEMDPVLEVYGPDLDLIERMDQTFYGEPETVTTTVLRTGRYYARVLNYHGSRSPGQYTIDASADVFDPAPRFGPESLRSFDAATGTPLVTDVNNDGLLDVVMNTSIPVPCCTPTADNYKVLTFLQQPDGSLAEAPRHVTATGGSGLASGDLNADGFPDVVLGTSSGVQLFMNDGAGALTPATSISTARVVDTVGIGNREGDPDLDVYFTEGNRIYVATNTPDGFVELQAATSPLVGETFADLSLGDLNDDGRLDFVGITGGTARVWRQNDSKAYLPSVALELGGQEPGGIEIGDVTGDGLPDVVVSVKALDPEPNEILVFAQDGAGALMAPVAYGTGSVGGSRIGIADMNDDGRSDVVRAPGPSGLLTLWEQQGDGTLGASETWAASGAGELALGDVNGDAMADVLTTFGTLIPTKGHLATLLQHEVGGPVPPEDPDLWVRNHAPADSSTWSSTGFVPAIRFGRDIDPASIKPWTVALLDATTGAPVQVTLTFDEASELARLTPNAPLASGHPYLLVVVGVRDLDANTMPGVHSISFSTA